MVIQDAQEKLSSFLFLIVGARGCLNVNFFYYIHPMSNACNAGN